MRRLTVFLSERVKRAVTVGDTAGLARRKQRNKRPMNKVTIVRETGVKTLYDVNRYLLNFFC